MSLNEMLATWPHERLVKELAQQAKGNATLRERVARQDVALFWFHAKDDRLRLAVADFIRAKGRHHTELGYKALVVAFDAVNGETPP